MTIEVRKDDFIGRSVRSSQTFFETFILLKRALVERSCHFVSVTEHYALWPRL